MTISTYGIPDPKKQSSIIQVRKTSQAALLVLLEQGLVEKSDVKEQVCPVIIRLTEADSIDDYRTEAVAVSIY